MHKTTDLACYPDLATAGGIPQGGKPRLSPASPAEEAVKALHASLTKDQLREICFPWDYRDAQRGLLRTFVSNHWYVTRPFIRGEFYTKQQQAIIHDIFTSLINPEWYGRFLKQMRDDTYGQDWGEEQSIALFGTPEAGPFQFVLTGRHMTLRADGGSDRQRAFGGPIFYGHAAGGFTTEKPNHPGNVFWPQAEAANQVYQVLDSKQRRHALLDRLPSETDLAFRAAGRTLPGIPVADLYAEQKTELLKVLHTLLDPFRVEDQARALECLQNQGGLERCHLAFYQEGSAGGQGPWDSWRLEGPAFVWYFRGTPHVHVWVNVAETPAVAFNGHVRDVVDPQPPPLQQPDRLLTGKASGQKLVAVCSIKNEIDIVETFVRHNLTFVDRLVLADNGSTDGTLDILYALAREGLPLTVIEDPSVGKYQAQRMTRLMHEQAVKRHGADWVLPLDADEFLVVPKGTSLIPEGASSDATLSLHWRTYVPDESDDPARLNPVLRMRHRLVREAWPFIKVLVPRKLAMRADAYLTQGNHLLHVGGQPCATVDVGAAYLAHFPIRGPGQYVAKTAISAFQYHAMGTQATGLGVHWKEPYDLLKRDVEAFASSIFEAARHFSVPPQIAFQPATKVDPLPYRGGPLLYTPMIDDRNRGWYSILGYTEHLARRYAALTNGLTPEQRIELEHQINAVVNPGGASPTEQSILKRPLEEQQAMLQRELKASRQENARLAVELALSWQQLRRLQQSWAWKARTALVRPASRALPWLKKLAAWYRQRRA